MLNICCEVLQFNVSPMFSMELGTQSVLSECLLMEWLAHSRDAVREARPLSPRSSQSSNVAGTLDTTQK